ncbi:MAG: PQQ-binding-like beta-propeller repeat protein [Planctomycetales bacterium]|nr:PQQ-binding-like beta-propeller repeat protein [Planctomycetales bacterium]
MRCPIVQFAFAFAVFLPLTASAENWPHWRGDGGNGVSLTAKPPVRWSATENVKWKAAVPGRGSGSPVVWEDQVFVVSAVPQGGADQPRGRGSLPTLAFVVISYDRESGKIRWQQTATVAKPHQGTHATNGFSSASPCTDGKHLYAHFGSRGLFCYTLDGKPVWKREFGEMNTRNSFGEGSSPTLVGDKILVPWDHEGPSALYCLDKASGKTIWKVDRDEPTNWSTPLVVEHGGKQQVVLNGQNFARAYDLETGKELWRCGGQTDRPAASAVSGSDLVFVGSGFRGSYLGAFRLDGQGDIGGTKHVAWSVDQNTPDIASPLLSGNRLYFYKGKTGLLTCVNATDGKPHYAAARIPGLSSIYASPIAANGHVYLTDRSGTTTVIKDADQVEVVASNSVGETVDATPAPVDNQLFIRGEQHLFCIE